MRPLPPANVRENIMTSHEGGVTFKPVLPPRPSHMTNDAQKFPSTIEQRRMHWRNSNKKGVYKSKPFQTVDKEFVSCESLQSGRNIYAPLPVPNTALLVSNGAPALPLRHTYERRSSAPVIPASKPIPAPIVLSQLRAKTLFPEDVKEEALQTNDNEEEGEYVAMNYPQVNPGTYIRNGNVSGHAKLVYSKCPSTDNPRPVCPIRNFSDDTESRDSPTCCPGSSRQHAVVEKLKAPIRSCSLDSATSILTKENVDEGGYEIPLPLQKPLYMSLENLNIKSSADESDVTGNEVRRLRRKKKLSSRSKRKANLSCNDAKEGTSSQADENGSKTPDLKSSGTRRNRKAKPYKGSLSSDSIISFTYPRSLLAKKEFFGSADFCSDFEDWTGHKPIPSHIDCSDVYSEHEYEAVCDFPGGRDEESPLDLKTSMKNAMSFMLTGKKRSKRCKSTDSGKPLNASNFSLVPMPRIRAMQREFRSAIVANCKWKNVATPGMATLNTLNGIIKDITL